MCEKRLAEAGGTGQGRLGADQSLEAQGDLLDPREAGVWAVGLPDITQSHGVSKGAEERLGSQVSVAEVPAGHHCTVCRTELVVTLWTLGVCCGSATVCVDTGKLPSSLGLWTESTDSAKGNFECAKESTYPCLVGKGANGRLGRWLTGSRERGKRWVNQEEEGSRRKV